MFTLPDKGEGQNDIQSILFQEQIDLLLDGLAGVNCVLSGCAVTAQGTPDMTVAVAKGAVLTNGVLKPVTAGNVTITAADGTNPRLDLIVADSTGAKACRAGTAAAAPKPPSRTANDVVLAIVYVPASDTTISSDQITDMRVVHTAGPILIDKVNTPVTFNTTNAIQTYYSLTLPSGLMAAGRKLRVHCGGTMLINNTTPTVTLTLAYGATTMVASVSSTYTNDTDRRPWTADFVLSAVSLTSQLITGNGMLGALGAYAPGATGIGGLVAGLAGVWVVGGSAAVNSDAADSVFTVQWTMSVSNINDEIVMDTAYAELI